MIKEALIGVFLVKPVVSDAFPQMNIVKHKKLPFRMTWMNSTTVKLSIAHQSEHTVINFVIIRQ